MEFFRLAVSSGEHAGPNDQRVNRVPQKGKRQRGKGPDIRIHSKQSKCGRNIRLILLCLRIRSIKIIRRLRSVKTGRRGLSGIRFCVFGH